MNPNNSNNYGELARQHLATVGIITAVGAAALKIDHYLGTRNVPETAQGELEMFAPRRPGANRTLVLMGGMCMGTRGVAERYESQLASDTNIAAPIAPDVGFSPKVMFEKTYEELEETNPEEIMMMGLSMGGWLCWDMLDYGLQTGRRELVERVSTMAVRGTPFGLNALKPGPKAALQLVGLFGHSYALDRGRPAIQRWSSKSLTEAPFSRVVPEARYILGKHAGSLAVMPERFIQLRGVDPDRYVYEDRSGDNIEKWLGHPIERVVDPERKKSTRTRGTHVPTDRRSAWFSLSTMDIAKPIAAQRVA